RDDGNLILEVEQERKLLSEFPEASTIVRPLIGTTEIRNGTRRACLWIDDDQVDFAVSLPPVKDRLEKTRDFRAKSKAQTTVGYAKIPHRFAQRCHQERSSIVLPKNTVEGIKYLTPNYVPSTTVTTDLAFVAFTDDIWVMSVLASTMHRVWAEAISGGLGSG